MRSVINQGFSQEKSRISADICMDNRPAKSVHTALDASLISRKEIGFLFPEKLLNGIVEITEILKMELK